MMTTPMMVVVVVVMMMMTNNTHDALRAVPDMSFTHLAEFEIIYVDDKNGSYEEVSRNGYD